MTRRTVSRVVAASTFTTIADVRNHGRWIPLTRAVLPAGRHGAPAPGPLPVGTRFTMLSRPGIVDRMEVATMRGPSPDGGSTTLRKAGPLLLGTAGIDVKALAPDSDGPRCLVTWWEDVYLAGLLPRALTAAVLSPVLGLVLRHALSTAERELSRP